MIERFFVVTRSGSIYEVSTERTPYGCPTIKKLTGPRVFEMPDGVCLEGGNLVGISARRVVLVSPPEECGRDFESVHMINHGGHTSAPCALFLDRADAETAREVDDLEPLDERYREKTLETLNAIGVDHPVFLIGSSVATHFELSAA